MKLFQYPILRVLTQGRIGVSIFSLVTGYVCALKPIRQFRAGTPDAAFSGIAKSAFRRLPRLWLPTTIATIISWFICQFGAFEVGRHVDNWWIPYSSPPITPNLGYAIEDLISNLISTWTNRLWNAYEINQWTLQPLLKGAFSIYILLFATAYVRPRYRMMISLGMCLYNFVSHDGMLKPPSTFSVPTLILSQLILACNSTSAPSSPIYPKSLPTKPGSQLANGRVAFYPPFSSLLV